MKRTIVIYWIVTVLMVLFVLYSSWLDFSGQSPAISQFKMLGYPGYLPPFIGILKLLALAGVLIPGFPRVTEMAYYGLGFVMTGVLYSHAVICHVKPCLILPFVMFFLVVLSYIYYQKRFDDLFKVYFNQTETR